MRKGFSLIELVVVSAILIIVSVGAITSFSSVIRAQRYAIRAQYLIDQSNYVIDYIGKELRMAKKEDGTINCLNYGRNYQKYYQGIVFIFFEETPKCRAFFLENGVIMDYEKNRNPEIIPITSSGVEIVEFNTEIVDSPGIQPIVYLSLKIRSSGFDDLELEFKTAISQRDLNFLLEP